MGTTLVRMRWLYGAIAALAAGSLTAAELSKCLDRSGHVTYSSERCEVQGLKSAGPIRERTTVIPAPGTSARPAARDFVQKEAAGKDAGGELRASPVQIKPVNPLVEKLLK